MPADDRGDDLFDTIEVTRDAEAIYWSRPGERGGLAEEQLRTGPYQGESQGRLAVEFGRHKADRLRARYDGAAVQTAGAGLMESGCEDAPRQIRTCIVQRDTRGIYPVDRAVAVADIE